MSEKINREDAIATVSEWARLYLYGPYKTPPIDLTSEDAVNEMQKTISSSLFQYLEARGFNIYSLFARLSDDSVVIDNGKPRKADLVHIEVRISSYDRPIVAGYAFAADFFDIDGDKQ